MTISKRLFSIKLAGLMLASTFAYGYLPVANAIDSDLATNQVKALTCKDNMTIDQALEHAAKANSQRDIGWRSFQENDYVDVERAIMISKAVELRYRWRVNNDGSILAKSERAEMLCSPSRT